MMNNPKTKKLKEMKTFDEMWQDLAPYLSVENGLDEGYADGKYTRSFAKYCKHIEGIDLSEDFYRQAKKNLKDLKNVNLRIMDARHTDYRDKEFGVVFNTSFHEFDLIEKDAFKLDFDLKTKMLEEMSRISDTIVFAEIDPKLNISGELYMIFNLVENHCLRVKKSNKLIDKVLPKLGYKQILCDKAVDIIKYGSEKEFIEDMLSWWSDVKVPSSDEEKHSMCDKIERVLRKHGYLQDLTFYDVFRYTVYQKQGNS